MKAKIGGTEGPGAVGKTLGQGDSSFVRGRLAPGLDLPLEGNEFLFEKGAEFGRTHGTSGKKGNAAPEAFKNRLNRKSCLRSRLEPLPRLWEGLTQTEKCA